MEAPLFKQQVFKSNEERKWDKQDSLVISSDNKTFENQLESKEIPVLQSLTNTILFKDGDKQKQDNSSNIFPKSTFNQDYAKTHISPCEFNQSRIPTLQILEEMDNQKQPPTFEYLSSNKSLEDQRDTNDYFKDSDFEVLNKSETMHNNLAKEQMYLRVDSENSFGYISQSKNEPVAVNSEWYLFSKHILLGDETAFSAGYLKIRGEEIVSFIPECDFDDAASGKQDIVKVPENQYVLPGIVDSNVWLHEGFSELISQNKYLSMLALKNGITSIIRQNIISQEEEHKEKDEREGESQLNHFESIQSAKLKQTEEILCDCWDVHVPLKVEEQQQHPAHRIKLFSSPPTCNHAQFFSKPEELAGFIEQRSYRSQKEFLPDPNERCSQEKYDSLKKSTEELLLGQYQSENEENKKNEIYLKDQISCYVPNDSQKLVFGDQNNQEIGVKSSNQMTNPFNSILSSEGKITEGYVFLIHPSSQHGDNNLSLSSPFRSHHVSARMAPSMNITKVGGDSFRAPFQKDYDQTLVDLMALDGNQINKTLKSFLCAVYKASKDNSQEFMDHIVSSSEFSTYLSNESDDDSDHLQQQKKKGSYEFKFTSPDLAWKKHPLKLNYSGELEFFRKECLLNQEMTKDNIIEQLNIICHDKLTSSPDMLLQDERYEFNEKKKMPVIQLFKQKEKQDIYSEEKDKSNEKQSSEKDHNFKIIRYFDGENNLAEQVNKSEESVDKLKEKDTVEDFQNNLNNLHEPRNQIEDLIPNSETQPSLLEFDHPTTSENLGTQLEGFELGSFTAIRRVNSICENNSDEEKDNFSPRNDKKIKVSNIESSSTPQSSLRLRAKQGSLHLAQLDISSNVQRSNFSLAERRNKSLAQSLSLDISGKQLGKSNTQQINHAASNSSLRIDGQSSSQQINSLDYLQFLSARPFFWEYFALQLYASVFKMIAAKEEVQRIIEKSESTIMTSPTILGIQNDTEKSKPQQQQPSLDPPGTFIFQNIANAISVVRLFTLSKSFANFATIHTEVSWPFLFFDSTQIINGDTRFKAEPAIQNQQNKQILQSCLFTSPHIIQMVGSFHSYVPQKYKFFSSANLPQNTFPGDFTRAINGLFSLGGQLPALWTVAMAGSSILLDQIKDNPQKICFQGKIKQKRQTNLFLQTPSHFLRMQTEKQAKQQVSWGEREGFSQSSSDEHQGNQSKESQEIGSFNQRSQEFEDKKEQSPLNFLIQNIINQKQQCGLEDSIEIPKLSPAQGNNLPEKTASKDQQTLSAEEESKLIRLVDVLSRNPARIFGLKNKGTIEPRKHADFFIFDPFSLSKFSAQVDLNQGFPPELHILNSQSVLGQVIATYLKGAKVFDSGIFDLTKVSSSIFPS